MAIERELDRFARAHATALLRFATVMAPAGVDAEDLVQECLVRVAPRLGHLDDEAAVAYSRRTITNLVTDEHRRRIRWLRFTTATGEPPRPVSTEEQMTEQDFVVGLLRSLPARQRAAVVLRYWAGMTEAEIAVTLSCRPGTVKSLISRGLGALRHHVDADQMTGRPHA